ncbi:MAG: RNA polymerase-associated protein RapA [Cellvibrionaceae bacterium]
MSIDSFMLGQRWVSNTEPELGLGIVAEINDRHISISFPACSEQRVYASNNAPLTRLRYHKGDTIVDNEEHSFTVTDSMEANGCLIYQCLDHDAQEISIHELELSCFVQFSNPKDRLFAGQIDKPNSYQLRLQTLQHNQRMQQSAVSGLQGARIEKLPHQLYIAHEVANRHAPRVLLADEVGLGKTIEAGLIIHQQLHTGRSKRVLICLPDSLIHQWLVEMLRRFNLQFSILDTQRCIDLSHAPDELDENDQIIPGGEQNPFEQAQLVICPLSLLTNNEKRQQQAIEAQWDLLVVDEAHHLEWQESNPSSEYQCVEKLAATATGLLLLTATPEQLGIESHFARLRLLDPHRYHDLQAFIAEEEQYKPVNQLVQKLLAEDPVSTIRQPDSQKQLLEFLGEKQTATLNNCLETEEQDEAIASAFQQLLDCHGTGRVLFRNTRASITGFPERNLIEHPLEAPSAYLENIQDASLSSLLQAETLIGDNWLAEDSRVAWLLLQLKALKNEKVLVICHHATTAMALEEFLRLRQGIRCADFHEGMSLLERDRAAAYFADHEAGAQVLICSEIGSEGRNFQFAHHLIMLDLPPNPDLLEQRIGRLDRIGQQQTVNIHVPFYENTAQEHLLAWYHKGINAIEAPCPASQNLWRQFEADLLPLLKATSDQTEWNTLLEQTHISTQTLLEELQAGRDQLLELNSCNHDVAEKLATDLGNEEQSEALESYMDAVFDEFNIDKEHHSEHSVVIRPSEHMTCHYFPGLTEEGFTGTFDRRTALSREDMQYLTWEHPMVTGAIEMMMSGEHGNTQVCTLKLRPLKPGTLLVEGVFTLNCPAPRSLQLPRFLESGIQRVLLDSNGNDLSHVVTSEHLNTLGERVPKGTARELIKHARDQINTLIGKAETLIHAHEKQAIEKAIQAVQTEMNAEKLRLETLAANNPNIRQEEINYTDNAKEQLQSYLQHARFTLNALRIGIVT